MWFQIGCNSEHSLIYLFIYLDFISCPSSQRRTNTLFKKILHMLRRMELYLPAFQQTLHATVLCWRMERQLPGWQKSCLGFVYGAKLLGHSTWKNKTSDWTATNINQEKYAKGCFPLGKIGSPPLSTKLFYHSKSLEKVYPCRKNQNRPKISGQFQVLHQCYHISLCPFMGLSLSETADKQECIIPVQSEIADEGKEMKWGNWVNGDHVSKVQTIELSHCTLVPTCYLHHWLFVPGKVCLPLSLLYQFWEFWELPFPPFFFLIPKKEVCGWKPLFCFFPFLPIMLKQTKVNSFKIRWL